MVDLRSPSDVRGVMRRLFGAAAGVLPDRITDGSLLQQPAPPDDNLNLPANAIAPLIVDSARRLLGLKVTTLFATDIVLPEALLLQKFGSLADLLHVHFNSLVVSGAFIVVCEGLLANPHDVTIGTTIDLLDEEAQRRFLMRVRDAIRTRICDKGGFDFTMTRAAELMAAKKVENAIETVINGLKDGVDNDACI